MSDTAPAHSPSKCATDSLHQRERNYQDDNLSDRSDQIAPVQRYMTPITHEMIPEEDWEGYENDQGYVFEAEEVLFRIFATDLLELKKQCLQSHIKAEHCVEEFLDASLDEDFEDAKSEKDLNPLKAVLHSIVKSDMADMRAIQKTLDSHIKPLGLVAYHPTERRVPCARTRAPRLPLLEMRPPAPLVVKR